MNNGASFCHVINKKHIRQDIPSIVIINHDWNGAAPSLSNKERINKMMKGWSDEIFLYKEVIIIFIREKVKKEQDPIAWIKKYFNIDSLEIIFLLFFIKGIKEIMLISRPIHVPSQLFEEIDIRELNNIMIKNKIFRLLKINKDLLIWNYIMVYMHKRFWFFRNI